MSDRDRLPWDRFIVRSHHIYRHGHLFRWRRVCLELWLSHRHLRLGLCPTLAFPGPAVLDNRNRR
jgi:hypothetical protein